MKIKMKEKKYTKEEIKELFKYFKEYEKDKRGFLDFFSDSWDMYEKSGFNEVMSVPILNLITIIVINLSVPFYFLIWLFKR